MESSPLASLSAMHVGQTAQAEPPTTRRIHVPINCDWRNGGRHFEYLANLCIHLKIGHHTPEIRSYNYCRQWNDFGTKNCHTWKLWWGSKIVSRSVHGRIGRNGSCWQVLSNYRERERERWNVYITVSLCNSHSCGCMGSATEVSICDVSVGKPAWVMPQGDWHKVLWSDSWPGYTKQHLTLINSNHIIPSTSI